MKALTQYKRQQPTTDRGGDTRRGKTIFDLSHDHKTTFSMGHLIPFVTLPTLPGDDWELGAEFMSRFAPLYLPIMHRCELQMAWFYVPNRILWRSPSGWEEYLTQEEELEYPYLNHPVNPIENPTSGTIRYNIYDYMGFPTRLTELIGATNKKLSAFPLAAYWAIYDQYYRNPQIQPEKFVPLVAGENGYYEVSTENIKVARKLWNRDYFTMALPEPQLGEEILVPMFNMDYLTPAGASPSGPWRLRDEVTDAVAADGYVSQNQWGVTADRGLLTADTNEVYLDVQETAATIRQFRMAARLQEYLEQLMRAGQRYSDFMESFWGVNPLAGVIQVPEFIGGTKANVIISEVLSTAETVDIPLAGYAGQALAIEGSKTYRHYCKEHGWIIGILSVTPRTSYMQGLSRHFNWNQTPLDLPWAHFEEIGDQAILNKEVYFTMTDNDATDTVANDGEWGYVPRYQQWKTQNDIVSGQMRNVWESFHMARILGIAEGGISPILGSNFITCIDPPVERVFQLGATQDHEIYAHIWNRCLVRRKLMRHGVPKL